MEWLENDVVNVVFPVGYEFVHLFVVSFGYNAADHDVWFFSGA